jgi:predicted transcriptional regulator
MELLTKSEQKLLITMLQDYKFQSNYKTSKLCKDKFFKSVPRLLKLELIKEVNEKELKTFTLTDLGIVLASNLSETQRPKVEYILQVIVVR